MAARKQRSPIQNIFKLSKHRFINLLKASYFSSRPAFISDPKSPTSPAMAVWSAALCFHSVEGFLSQRFDGICDSECSEWCTTLLSHSVAHTTPLCQSIKNGSFLMSVFFVFNLFRLASGDQRTFEFLSASLEISSGASSQLVLFVLHCNLIATGGNRCLNTFHYERPGCKIQGFRSAGNLSGM